MDERLQELLRELEGYSPGAAEAFLSEANADPFKGQDLFGEAALPGGEKGGGFLGITGKSASIGAGVSAVSNALVPQPKPKRATTENARFFNDNRDLEKQLNSEVKIQDIRSKVTDVASAIPVWGPLIKLADSIGTGVDRATKDEFGIYGSGGGQVLDRILDPVGNITDLFTGGYDQEGRKSKRRQFQNREVAGAIGQNRQTGNIVRNNLPKYTAPSYGKQGMKFKSKFAS
jgi:hypothetical protein